MHPPCSKLVNSSAGDHVGCCISSLLAVRTTPCHAEEAQGAEPGRDYVLRYSSQQHYEKITGRLRMLREWRVRCRGSAANSRRGACIARTLVERSMRTPCLPLRS